MLAGGKEVAVREWILGGLEDGVDVCWWQSGWETGGRQCSVCVRQKVLLVQAVARGGGSKVL